MNEKGSFGRGNPDVPTAVVETMDNMPLLDVKDPLFEDKVVKATVNFHPGLPRDAVVEFVHNGP